MANFWDFLADKTNDSSISDPKELIDKAGDDFDKDNDGKTNDDWGNSSVGGSNVADSSDYSASSGFTYCD